jgi:hypothetical protein
MRNQIVLLLRIMLFKLNIVGSFIITLFLIIYFNLICSHFHIFTVISMNSFCEPRNIQPITQSTLVLRFRNIKHDLIFYSYVWSLLQPIYRGFSLVKHCVSQYSTGGQIRPVIYNAIIFLIGPGRSSWQCL